MQKIELRVHKRTESGKSVARQLRREGNLPGVLYGPDVEALALAADAREVKEALSTSSGENVIINLTVDQDGVPENCVAIFKAVQRNFLKGEILHVDLLRISMDKPIEINVPLEFINTNSVEREGLILQRSLDELAVKCLPADIPDSVVIDASLLSVTESMHVSDIKLDEKIEIMSDPGEVVATLLVPRMAEELEAMDAAAAEGLEAPGEEGEAAEEDGEDRAGEE